MSAFPIGLLSLLLVRVVTADNDNETLCYWPDGSVAVGDVPCNTSASGYSSCCATGDVCYKGTICASMKFENTFYRSSCTDQLWRDSNDCTMRCAFTNVRSTLAGPEILTKCSGDNKWACNGLQDAVYHCENNAYSLSDDDFIVVTSLAAASASTSTSASSSPTTKGSTSSEPSTSTTPSDESQQDHSTQGPTVRKGEMAGGVVGGIFGGIVVGALGMWLFSNYMQRRDRDREAPAMANDLPIAVSESNSSSEPQTEFLQRGSSGTQYSPMAYQAPGQHLNAPSSMAGAAVPTSERTSLIMTYNEPYELADTSPQS
ncbi:uncharacterized protein B0I36DRAFT_321878 [Microdochium trichocladiopsis]|uniref:Uncharacterized protein n=1 Tax=Microdochium trichocladiopsis TaxID=1682393 RepID=A0A9P8YAC6_9PEZI|nr:uncharacterized protein B0I36DRAFT_321878 [Microdochium trichocladiopsis]KAH7033680.1 hypothetical protein B0I36DRAFT_321878 [Microdochium trichocladiopsis]